VLDQTVVDTQAAPVVHHRIVDRRLRRHHKGDSHRLTALGGIAAMSLDALSSVAYGPEAIVLGLIAAGTAAVTWNAPAQSSPRCQSGSTDVTGCGSSEPGDIHRVAAGGGADVKNP
jgi:hypothetical protein